MYLFMEFEILFLVSWLCFLVFVEQLLEQNLCDLYFLTNSFSQHLQKACITLEVRFLFLVLNEIAQDSVQKIL